MSEDTSAYNALIGRIMKYPDNTTRMRYLEVQSKNKIEAYRRNIFIRESLGKQFQYLGETFTVVAFDHRLAEQPLVCRSTGGRVTNFPLHAIKPNTRATTAAVKRFWPEFPYERASWGQIRDWLLAQTSLTGLKKVVAQEILETCKTKFYRPDPAEDRGHAE